MGGDPLAVFLSLALPRDTAQSWVDGFLRGLLTLAAECKVSLAGGDSAESSSAIVADIVLLGGVQKGRAVLSVHWLPRHREILSIRRAFRVDPGGRRAAAPASCASLEADLPPSRRGGFGAFS